MMANTNSISLSSKQCLHIFLLFVAIIPTVFPEPVCYILLVVKFLAIKNPDKQLRYTGVMSIKTQN
ncbi:MAG: hypothetical protein DRQ47_07975 [Gammaproteobacteria bacterium]|nr:MAG: hypothetical protein DRQ47_07975 [Gammaproteobacteria bacterium]